MSQETYISQLDSSKIEQLKTLDVTNFFLRFARALMAGDIKKIAQCWALPSLAVGDSFSMAMTTTTDIETLFAGIKQQYQVRGIAEAKPIVQSLTWATELMAVVDIRWPYIDRHGAEIGAESSIYTVKRDETGEVKILCALMKGTLDADNVFSS